MENIPRISIITPSYNQGKYLRETIESVLSQNYANFEYIIIDGDSSDESVDIIKHYQSRLAFWVSENDTGQSDALNKGFKIASGDILTWVNSDDILLPNALNNISDMYRAGKQTDWVSSKQLLLIDEESKVIRCANYYQPSDILGKIGLYIVSGPSTFFSKELFLKSNGFNEELSYTMDTDLWWQFYKLGSSCQLIDKPLFGFRCHAKSKTTSHMFALDDLTNTRIESESVTISEKYSKGFGSKQVTIADRFMRVVTGSYTKAIINTRKCKGLHWRDCCHYL